MNDPPEAKFGEKTLNHVQKELDRPNVALVSLAEVNVLDLDRNRMTVFGDGAMNFLKWKVRDLRADV